MPFSEAKYISLEWKASGAPISGRTEMPTARVQTITKNGIRTSQATKRSAVSLNIREASFEDYHSITALQVRNGLSTRSPEEWAALWKENPVYRRMRGD